MEAVVVEMARQKGVRLATAESCTGGMVSHRITNISGSSEIFGFGWVTYANEAKIRELGISESLLKTAGAVSREVVEAMARGALRQSEADLAVAVSGIAGPSGGTPEKPVGTAWFAVATKSAVRSWEQQLSTDRKTFKSMASQIALNGLRIGIQNLQS
jgi:nicotinamide-nucleotide amidase